MHMLRRHIRNYFNREMVNLHIFTRSIALFLSSIALSLSSIDLSLNSIALSLSSIAQSLSSFALLVVLWTLNHYIHLVPLVCTSTRQNHAFSTVGPQPGMASLLSFASFPGT